MYWRFGGGRMWASVCRQQPSPHPEAHLQALTSGGGGSRGKQKGRQRSEREAEIRKGGRGQKERQRSERPHGRAEESQGTTHWAAFRARLDHPAPPGTIPSDRARQTEPSDRSVPAATEPTGRRCAGRGRHHAPSMPTRAAMQAVQVHAQSWSPGGAVGVRLG